jgi:Cu+-exporting ATPase
MTATATATTVELRLGGMTCASCAARIERRLNKFDGVHAKVNYATETATVDADGVAVGEMIAAVESIGYTASIATPPEPSSTDAGAEPVDDEHDRRLRPLRDRLIACTVLTFPVLALSMIPSLQFDSWQWLCFTLAAPVVAWGGWPFHKAAWANLRHAAATMDTLISLGTIAAFAWSAWALFLGDAGDPAMRMQFDITPSAGAGTNELYLEVASVVTVFILAGRFFEGRA